MGKTGSRGKRGSSPAPSASDAPPASGHTVQEPAKNSQTAPDDPLAAEKLSQASSEKKDEKATAAAEPKKKFLFGFTFEIFDEEKNLKEEKTVRAFADDEEEGMNAAITQLKLPEGWTYRYTQKFTRVPVQ